jgi:hypothetical protein
VNDDDAAMTVDDDDDVDADASSPSPEAAVPLPLDVLLQAPLQLGAERRGREVVHLGIQHVQLQEAPVEVPQSVVTPPNRVRLRRPGVTRVTRRDPSGDVNARPLVRGRRLERAAWEDRQRYTRGIRPRGV